MRITKAQSQENRARIVETASALFRERGYDGVSVADLMAAAGLTHGGFYKHFASKADLMAETAELGMSQTLSQAEAVDLETFVNFYLSREHRDGRSGGCTVAALSGDAARQTAEVKATFAAGIEGMLASVKRGGLKLGPGDPSETRARAIDLFAHLLGAVMLSRACPDDSPLADEVLNACRAEILAQLAPSSGA